jgi:hypothetical protein
MALGLIWTIGQCAPPLRLSLVDGLPPLDHGSAKSPLLVVSPPLRAFRDAITRGGHVASTAALNQRKYWVSGSQIRGEAAR